MFPKRVADAYSIVCWMLYLRGNRKSAPWHWLGFFPGMGMSYRSLAHPEGNGLGMAMNDQANSQDVREASICRKRLKGTADRSGGRWGDAGSERGKDSCLGKSRGSARALFRAPRMPECKIYVFQNITPLSEA